MKQPPLDQRIDNIEAQLKYLTNKIDDIHETLKMALQSHAEEKIMSAKDVAEFLDMDINVVYAKCSRGELPFFKTGKLMKFKRTEIIAWVKKQDKNVSGSVDDLVSKYLQRKVLKA